MKNYQKYIKLMDSGVISEAAQALTNAWAVYGSTIVCEGYNSTTLWLDIDANDSINIQFRFGLYRVLAGNLYYPIIHTVDSDKVRFRSRYFEYDVDGTDLRIVEKFGLAEAKAFRLEVKCDTVGAAAGIINSAHYNISTAVE